MSEFNDNRQPRRRRTQLNAAQYAGQQTLDNSIPLIRTEDAPRSPRNPSSTSSPAPSIRLPKNITATRMHRKRWKSKTLSVMN